MEINLVLSISLDVLSCVWCMHAWHEKYKMTCCAQEGLTDYDLMYALWRQEKHISNLIWFFSQIFLSSHTISIIFYSNKHFSWKFLFDHFQHGIFFWQHLFILDRTHFFYHFQKYFFLKKTNKTFIFLFFIQNKTSSYFEKET